VKQLETETKLNDIWLRCAIRQAYAKTVIMNQFLLWLPCLIGTLLYLPV